MHRVAGQIHRGSYLGECSGRVSGWEVSEEETLSDRLYILMDVAMGGPSRTRGPGRPPGGG